MICPTLMLGPELFLICAKSLRNSGLDVETIDLLKDPYSSFFKAKRLVKNVVFRKNYLRDREPFLLRAYASEVAQRLARIDPDLIFSPGTKPVAYLKTDKPIVFWGDATFDGMVDFYPEFTRLCSELCATATKWSRQRFRAAALPSMRRNGRRTPRSKSMMWIRRRSRSCPMGRISV